MAAISVNGLRKSYGGVVALDDMSLDVEAGTIHAVVGENGAGKSTLMKIVAGVVQPDSGTIRLDGTQVELETPREARGRGIGIVYQELSIFPDRSILANLFVNREPQRRGLISVPAMVRRACPMLERLGLRADVRTPVGHLTIGEQQLVELARVLLERPRILILDEPNSALSERETQRLFSILRELSGQDIAILYVSHRLEEVFDIADRVTVMRDGRHVVTGGRHELSIPQVIEAMVGRRQGEMFPRRNKPAGDLPGDLILDGLTVGDSLTDVSFTARSGEVIGLAGLEGAGVALLLGTLFGAHRATGGTVRYPDGGGLPGSPTEAARRGISLVPADRRNQGLMLSRSVASNIAQVAVGAFRAANPWLPTRRIARSAATQIRQLGVKTPSRHTPVNELSGGNQQKIVVAKWLEVDPGVFLLDDPTRGVDVGAKREIYELIRQLADSGKLILFRSTELPELLGLADRIIVFYRGRLTASCRADEVDSAGLLHAINTGSFGRNADAS